MSSLFASLLFSLSPPLSQPSLQYLHTHRWTHTHIRTHAQTRAHTRNPSEQLQNVSTLTTVVVLATQGGDGAAPLVTAPLVMVSATLFQLSSP